MPLAAGYVGILPALTLLNVEEDGSPALNISWGSAILWSCAIAFFGRVHWYGSSVCNAEWYCSVFLSPPLRKQVVSTLSVFGIDRSSISMILTDYQRRAKIPFGYCHGPTHLRTTWTTSFPAWYKSSPRLRVRRCRWIYCSGTAFAPSGWTAGEL